MLGSEAAARYFKTHLSDDPKRRLPMHSEPLRQLIHRRTAGVRIGQRGPIRDAQTGLRAKRILRHWTARILYTLAPGTTT